MRFAAVALALVVAGPLAARAARPRTMPVARITKNLEELVAAHPVDAHAHYLLGRVLCFRFAVDESHIPLSTGSDSDPRDWKLYQSFGNWRTAVERSLGLNGSTTKAGQAASERTEQELAWLAGAIQHLSRAVELAPDEPLYRQCFAYTLEIGAHVAHAIDTCYALRISGSANVAQLALDGDEGRRIFAQSVREDLERALPALNALRLDPRGEVQAIVRPLLAEYWLRRSQLEYFAVFQRTTDEDRARTTRSGDLSGYMSWEASLAIERIAKGLGPRNALTEAQRNDVRCGLDELRKIPIPRGRVVSPIVFSLDGPHALSELIGDGRVARFDLDADGVVENWSWPNASTAILVWDPDASGVVRDGTQLFGERTWNLFFANGYDAMSLLDDDHDGWLRHEELRGLAVWHDRDANGRSDAGEVTPIERTGVRALECAATHVVDRMLGNARGLVFNDGRALPTYDWWATRMPSTAP